MNDQAPPWPPQTILDWANGGTVNTDWLIEELRAWMEYFRPVAELVQTVELCSQCSQPYKTCKKCGEKVIFVPKAGFGCLGEWRHLEPPKHNVGHHLPHPELVIT